MANQTDGVGIEIVSKSRMDGWSWSSSTSLLLFNNYGPLSNSKITGPPQKRNTPVSMETPRCPTPQNLEHQPGPPLECFFLRLGCVTWETSEFLFGFVHLERAELPTFQLGDGDEARFATGMARCRSLQGMKGSSSWHRPPRPKTLNQKMKRQEK
jgi:hypothetical protein